MNKKRLKIIKEIAKQYGAAVVENAPQGGIFMDGEKVDMDAFNNASKEDQIKYKAYLIHSIPNDMDDWIDFRALTFEEWKEIRIKQTKEILL